MPESSTLFARWVSTTMSMIHDYSWICPRVTLINGTGRYCHEPVVSECRSCVRKNGSRLGEPISVPAHRARSATWLGKRAVYRRPRRHGGATEKIFSRSGYRGATSSSPFTPPTLPQTPPCHTRGEYSASA